MCLPAKEGQGGLLLVGRFLPPPAAQPRPPMWGSRSQRCPVAPSSTDRKCQPKSHPGLPHQGGWQSSPLTNNPKEQLPGSGPLDPPSREGHCCPLGPRVAPWGCCPGAWLLLLGARRLEVQGQKAGCQGGICRESPPPLRGSPVWSRQHPLPGPSLPARDPEGEGARGGGSQGEGRASGPLPPWLGLRKAHPPPPPGQRAAAAGELWRRAGGAPEAGSSVGELEGELGAWRRGLEAQVGEVLRLAAPLPQALAQLQRQNRLLRAQLQRLARQLQRHGSLLGEQSLDLEDWDLDSEETLGRGGGGSPEAEWGPSQVLQAEEEDGPQQQEQQPPKERAPGLTRLPPEAASSTLPPQRPNPAPEAHAPVAVALRMPHQPVTAVTKVSETFSGETTRPTVTPYVSGGQHANSHAEPAQKAPSQADGSCPAPSAVRTWSATSTRTATTASSERFSSVTKSVSAVSYESTTSITNLPLGAPPRSPSPPLVAHHQTERRRELVRSQTLPRTSSTQARKALFEKFEQQDTGGKGKGGGRPKLKRSQSFGVASASSIKQILLDWCRSKTIGYKHIDLQNFSCSWNDGMAFCALVHSFFPEAFDYQALEPGKRKENFELAFTTAEKMAGCDRLIEVDDMLAMGRKPDPMCVFTYVQSLYNHLRRFE
ncbi:smoothelin-like protein 2 [Sceloporus undulatus]|uniref:smoothelin-like protein 2 n=1 Tax=Sceloporus undulatus TaxID=8520 RepID=UPI001C4CFA50|nr:smoothelin-like protein 2 [Sceloporus undulatus]